LIVHHHIDSVYLGRITGWAFAEEQAESTAPLIIEAWHADMCLGRTVANRPRPDVGNAFTAFENSSASGFDLEFRLPNVADDTAEIQFQASSAGHNAPARIIGTAQHLSQRGFDTAVAAGTKGDRAMLPTPFPWEVVAVVRRFWPDSGARLSRPDFQDEFADRIIALARGAESARITCLVRYLRFLRAIWAHFQFVSRYFPNINSAVAFGSKDDYCKQNTPEEMLSVAHHLYVLKTLGLTGDFAEFGCFKGFSSSMLSYACELLGIRMHIFDSFEGLPSSDSCYYGAGDFRGELLEVQRNVEKFGAPSGVAYHKGFFADSLPVSDIPGLISLWMDVDLASSAQDVMMIAEKIDSRGAVFSHECEAANFVDGRIVAQSDSVIPSIVDRFSKLGAPVTGQFLSGNTGAFWRRDGGVPVLSARTLMKVMTSI
jgi:O-methyltransferase